MLFVAEFFGVVVVLRFQECADFLAEGFRHDFLRSKGGETVEPDGEGGDRHEGEERVDHGGGGEDFYEIDQLRFGRCDFGDSWRGIGADLGEIDPQREKRESDYAELHQ